MAAAAPKEARRHRWLWVLGGTVGFLLLLVLGLFTLLATAASRALLVREALVIVNAQFAGRIDLQKAWLFPNGHFIAHDVSIRGPDGAVIVRAATVETHVDLLALAKKRLHLTGTTVGGAALFLATDAKGDVNIAEAFLPKHPSPPAPKPADASPGFGFTMDIDGADVEVDEAQLAFGSTSSARGAPSPPSIDLRRIALHTTVSLDAAGVITIQTPSLRGNALAPLTAAVQLSAAVRLQIPDLQIATDATLDDDAHLKAAANLNITTLAGLATLTDSSIGPHFLARWLPDLEPRGVRVAARVALQAKTLRLLSSEATPLERKGGGALHASGRIDFDEGAAEATLVGKGIDARALFGVLPKTSMDFRIEARGEDVLHDSRRLSAHLAVDQSVIEGQPVGPGVAEVGFAGQTVQLTGVDIAFPGGRVRGAGWVAARQVSAKARIDAPDLGALRAALEGLSGLNLPDFAGRLQSQAEIEGPLTAPALHANVQATHVSLNGIEADQLTAHLDAPRLGRQMDLQGQATIAQLALADRLLHDIGLSVAWSTPDLHLEIQARQKGEALALVADLLVPKDLSSATVSSLTLHAGGTDWLLAGPAVLDFRDGVALDRAELRSDPQRLRLSLKISPKILSGKAEVEALDLAQLPATLLPSFKLAGQVEGVASYVERAGQHQGSANLTLRRVACRGLTIPSGKLQATLQGGHVTVDLSAKLGHGEVTLTGAGPLPREPGKLAADLEATGIVLDDFAGVVPRLTGTHAALSLSLRLAGNWAAPELSVTSSATGVTGPWTLEPEAGVLAVPLAFELAARLNSTGLTENLQLQAGPNPLLTLSGTAPIPSRKLAELFETPRRLVAELVDAPLDEHLTLVNLPLVPVIRRLRGAPILQGTLSAKGSIRGTLRAPRGELTLSGRQLAYEEHRLGNLEAELSAGDRGLSGRAELQPPQGKLTATVDWRLEPERLGNAKDRMAAPLNADVQLAGVPLSTVLGELSTLQGIADATATYRGSLAQPSARVKASLTNLQLQKVPAGMLDAEASWNGTHLVATLTGQQPQGGHLEGRAALPMTFQGELANQPLQATLDAKGFELAPFGAFVVQGGALRSLAGRLDSKLELRGMLAAPVPQGTLALSNGKLALAGFGQFSDIEAALSIDAGGIDLQKLTGKSAGGTFSVQGQARRGPAKGYAVHARLDTQRLGVFASDRLLGFLTSTEDLTGSFDRVSTSLALAVHHALFRLPTLVPKSAGPTSLDPEIVLGNSPPPTPKVARVEKPYAIRLAVVAPDSLELKATDLDIKARADLTVSVEGSTTIKGGVFATQGTVNAYGRRFKIDHADVTFGQDGDFGPAGDPSLDARASEKIGPYRLFVDVSGPVSAPSLVASSEPPLDKEQVGDLLVTGSADGVGGKISASPSQTGGLAAASALGGVVSEKLREWLGPYMPLDVLTVDPNHLEAGKHLTPRLYVGAIENLGVTDPRVNGAEIHANYRLTDHWALDSTYGTAQAGDLDLQWTRSW